MSGTKDIAQGLIALLGRICFSLIFILAGVHKIVDFNTYVSTLGGHWFISMPALAIIMAIIFELLGGALVFFGFFTRYGAFLLFLFICPTTFFLHSFWLFESGAEKLGQMQHFLKNLSMIGGSLYVMAYGAGKFSFDRWLRKKHD